MKNNILEIKNLYKSFNNKGNIIDVINNISFNIKKGEIISIVGSSGCGKSTLLSIIAGLEESTKGSINYNFDNNNIGYMLQEPALFSWFNIITNAKLGCLIKGIDNNRYINELLTKYGISEFKYKFPKDLSGGMKQRVALIRTISTKPDLLLLDEPFAALDYQSRLSISKDVFDLIKENNVTAILITHDISEAISMSDKVIVLSKRPCRIKNTYNIKLNNKSNPIENRKDDKFMYYYNLIAKDLDLFET